MNYHHDKVYKLDTKGKVRVWWIESTDNSYRTHSGILDGKIVTSGWIYPTEKNIGKVNETSIKEQTQIEVEAEYELKLFQGKYHRELTSIENGAQFFEPMLAQKFDPKKDTKYPYCSQPKIDGLRGIVSAYGMQTRQGKPFVSAPHIFESLKPFFEKYPNYVLDGELYNHELKHDFEKIISLARKTKPTDQDLIDSRNMVQFHVYDVVTNYNYKFHNRMLFLESIQGEFDYIKIVPTVYVDSLDEVYTVMNEYILQGYEGQMLRDPNSFYENKRSKNLLKHKEFEDKEFELVSVVEGVGNWSGMAKSIEIRLEDGTTQHSGMRGSFEYAKHVLDNPNRYKEVTVRFQGRTADGKLRFPVVTAFWETKRNL